MNPLVSVCMITYNHEKFIVEAIEGVLMQEVDFEVELIIADDCSSDKTSDLVKDLISIHPRGNWIKYTRHAENIGMMPNFIWSIGQAKGKYVALCEGDDFWIDKFKLQKQINFLEENPDFSLISHYSKKVDDSSGSSQLIGKLHKDVFQLNDPDYHFLSLPTASIVFLNIILFPDWVNKVYGGDRALIFLASQYGKIKIMDFVGSIYRVHENGIEQSYKKDKLSLPLRNLKEYPIYYELAPQHFKKYIADKISWNNFYLSIIYLVKLRLFHSIVHLGKSVYWKIKSN